MRGRDPTDGPVPGTRTAPGRPPATPDGGPGTADDPLLTIDEVIAELRVSRAAFYRWRRQEAGPAVVRLPGGGVRVRRSALTAWLNRMEMEEDASRARLCGQVVSALARAGLGVSVVLHRYRRQRGAPRLSSSAIPAVASRSCGRTPACPRGEFGVDGLDVRQDGSAHG